MCVFPLGPLCLRQLCPRDGYVCLSISLCHRQLCPRDGYVCLSVGSLMSQSALPRRWLCLSFRWFPYVTVSFAQGMVMCVFPLVPSCIRQLCPEDGYVCLSVDSLMSPSALPKGWLCVSFHWFPYITVSFAQEMVMSVFPLVPLCHRQLCPGDGYVCLSVGSLMSPSALPRGWFPHVFVSFAQGIVMVFMLVPLCLRQLCPGGYVCLSLSSSALPRGWFPHVPSPALLRRWLCLSFRWFPYVSVSFAQGMVPSCLRQLCPGDGYVCLSVGSLMSQSALPRRWLCLSFRWFPYVTVSFAQGVVMCVFPLVPSCIRQFCPEDGYVCLSVGSLMSPSALPKGWLCVSFHWFPYITVSFAQEMVMSVFPLVPLCHRQLCPGDGYVCLSVGSLMSPSALPKGWLCVSFRWFPHVSVSFAQEMVMSVFPLVPLCHRQLCPRDGYVCLSVGSLMYPSALPRGWFPHVFVSFAKEMVMFVFMLVPLCLRQLCPGDGSLMSPSALPRGCFPHVFVSFAQGMVMSVFPLVPLCHRQLCPRDGYVCLSVGSLMSPSALPKGWLCLSFRWFPYVTVSFAQGWLCLSFRWFPYVTVSFAQGMVMSVFPLVPSCHRQLYPGDGSLMSSSALLRRWLCLSFRWFPYVTVSFAQGMVMSVFPLVPLCHRQLCPRDGYVCLSVGSLMSPSALPRDGYVCLSVGSLMSPSALPRRWLCLSFRWFPYVTVSFAQEMVMSVFPLVPLCHRQLCPGDGYVCLSVGSLMSPPALPRRWLCLSFRWFPYVTVSFAQEMVMSVFPLVPLCHRQLCPGDGYVCLSVGSLMSPSALDGYVCLSVGSLMSVSFAQGMVPSCLRQLCPGMVMSVFPLVPLCHLQLCPRDGYVCLSVGFLMSPSALPKGWLCLSFRWFPYVTVSFAQGMVMSVFPLVPLCHRQLYPGDGYVCLSVGSFMSPSALPRGWLCLSFR